MTQSSPSPRVAIIGADQSGLASVMPLTREGDGEIRSTSDLDRLEQEITRIAPADTANIRRFLNDPRREARPHPMAADRLRLITRAMRPT